MSKIIFTGTSSGYPSKDRACSSFIAKTTSGLYQFDAGDGFSSSVQRRGLDVNNIGKIFISHLHPDHIAGLFLELQFMYLIDRKKPLDIFVPAEAFNGLVKATDLFYLFKEKFPFKYNFKPILSKPFYRDIELSVEAYPNLHLTGNIKVIKEHKKSNKMQSFSFIIKVDNKRILYSGDLAQQDDIGCLMDNVHTAIIEGMHVDLKSLLSTCMAKKTKRLVLTHLPDETLEKPQNILKIAEKAGFKKLIIAYDGLQLKI